MVIRSEGDMTQRAGAMVQGTEAGERTGDRLNQGGLAVCFVRTPHQKSSLSQEKKSSYP